MLLPAWPPYDRNSEVMKTARAGLQLCYHNHNFEFRAFDGMTGYDQFLRLTDAGLVKLRLDCGWMAAPGIDTVSHLARNSGFKSRTGRGRPQQVRVRGSKPAKYRLRVRRIPLGIDV